MIKELKHSDNEDYTYEPLVRPELEYKAPRLASSF